MSLLQSLQRMSCKRRSSQTRRRQNSAISLGVSPAVESLERRELLSAVNPSPITVTGPTGSTDVATPTITWTAANGATGYELLVYDFNAGREVIHETGLSTNSFTPSSVLPSGSSYQVFVRSFNSAGFSVWSAPHMFEVVGGVRAPGVPTLIGPSANTETSTPTISWTAADRATEYELHVYDINAGRQVIHQTGLRTTSFVPSSVLPGGKSYQVFVRSSNSVGCSAWSTPITFDVVGGIQATEVPILVDPSTSTNDTTPTISWYGVDGTTGYELHVYDINAGRQVIRETDLPKFDPTLTAHENLLWARFLRDHGSSILHSFTPTTLLEGGSRYQVFVRSFSSAGAGEWSSPLEFDLMKV